MWLLYLQRLVSCKLLRIALYMLNDRSTRCHACRKCCWVSFVRWEEEKELVNLWLRLIRQVDHNKQQGVDIYLDASRNHACINHFVPRTMELIKRIWHVHVYKSSYRGPCRWMPEPWRQEYYEVRMWCVIFKVNPWNVLCWLIYTVIIYILPCG